MSDVKKQLNESYLSLHPRPVVNPMPPLSNLPSRCLTRRVRVSLSSLMIPDLVITEPNSRGISTICKEELAVYLPFETKLILLPGRPSKGVAALEQAACGNSLELGERRPWRNIRWLKGVLVKEN